jgi:hypothetical protein
MCRITRKQILTLNGMTLNIIKIIKYYRFMHEIKSKRRENYVYHYVLTPKCMTKSQFTVC